MEKLVHIKETLKSGLIYVVCVKKNQDILKVLNLTGCRNSEYLSHEIYKIYTEIYRKYTEIA